MLRKMYHECKLVHADLSEYNIPYHDSHLYIADVSQSVEHDHLHTFDFLRNDVKNVEEYFGRRGVAPLGLRRCFKFVTREASEADGETDLSESSRTGWRLPHQRLLPLLRAGRVMWTENELSDSTLSKKVRSSSSVRSLSG